MARVRQTDARPAVAADAPAADLHPQPDTPQTADFPPIPPEPAAPNQAAASTIKPGSIISGEQFFAFTKALRPEDWAHIDGYIYRAWPILIDDRSPKNIDKIGGPVDEEYMRREHGSGDYSFVLNDSNIKGQYRAICRCKRWGFRDPANPPVIPDLTHIARSDPANRDYVNSLVRSGKLMPDGSIPQPAAAAAPAGNDPNLTGALRSTLDRLLAAQLAKPEKGSTDVDALSRVMDMLQKGHEQSITMLLSSLKQQDPNNIVQLLSALKEMMPKPEPPANPLAALKEIAGLFREVFQPPAAAVNPVAQLRELFSVANEFKEMAEPVARPGGRGHWMEYVAPYVPQALDGLSRIAMGFAATRMPAPGTPRANGAYAMGPGSGPHQSDVPALTAPAPDPLPAPTQQLHAPDDPAVQQLVHFLPFIAGPLITFLNSGRGGDDFAEYLAEGYGQITYQQVAQLSAAQIRAALEQHPQLAALCQAMPAAVDQFIADFLTPPPPAEDGIIPAEDTLQ